MRISLLLLPIALFFSSLSHANPLLVPHQVVHSAVNSCVKVGDIATIQSVLDCVPGKTTTNGRNIWGECTSSDPTATYVEIRCSLATTQGSGYPVRLKKSSNLCEVKQGKQFDYIWNMLTSGWDIIASEEGCLAKSVKTNYCTQVDGQCGGLLMYTGDIGTLAFPLNAVNPYPKICKKDPAKSGFKCPIDVNKNGLPDDTDQEFDPDAVCGYDAVNKFACSGGTFEHEPTEPDPDVDPDEPETEPDTDVPAPEPSTPPTSGNTVTPDAPPPVPDVNDSNSGDMSGVISAIHAQNRDINTGINNVIVSTNKGFAEINTRLNTANENTRALNDNLSKQLLQDYQIYKASKAQREETNKLIKEMNDAFLKDNEQVKKLLTDSNQIQTDNGLKVESVKRAVDENTRSVKGVENAITKTSNDLDWRMGQIQYSLENSTSEIKSTLESTSSYTQSTVREMGHRIDGSIQSQTNQLSSKLGDVKGAIDGQTDALGNALDELGNKLDDLKPCEPTKENNYCENPHGLGSDYVNDALNQADKAVSGAMSTYEKTVTDAANNLLEKNLTTESEGHISAISNSFLSVLPEPSQCMNLSIPTINGNQVSIDCQFSEKLKMILSILIYIYTIKTLVEILLTEVTPVPSNKPGSGRYY
ncbi:TPA: hypothetical protein NJ393_000225 [Vibrio parahaemolyticus]|nr:hypothetical protein [Vibrio parahaemolyticus]